MDTQDETLGWKQRAIKEHILHQEALQKISVLTAELDQSKQLFKKTSEYNKYFENKFYSLEKKYANQETKLLNTIAILKKAQQLIQQRKHEAELQHKKHASTNDSLLAQIDLLSAKNSQLTLNNTQLKQELQLANQNSSAAKLQLEQTSAALEKTRTLSTTQEKELKRYNKGENLEEFFVYKVLDSNTSEATTRTSKSRQK